MADKLVTFLPCMKFHNMNSIPVTGYLMLEIQSFLFNLLTNFIYIKCAMYFHTLVWGIKWRTKYMFHLLQWCKLVVVHVSSFTGTCGIWELTTMVHVLLSTSSLVLLGITVITLAVTSALIAVVGLFLQKWRLEKQLKAFPEVPDRHWFFGHLHKVLMLLHDGYYWLSVRNYRLCYLLYQ